MRSRRLEIGPVGAFPRLIIGIAAPGDCIHRSNGAASQVACYHGKGGRPAAAVRNGAGAVRDVSVFRLDVEGDLHPVRRVSAAGIQYLVIAQDMIHVLLVPVDGIVPAGPGAHHVGVGNGVFLCVAAVPFHGPVDVSGTVIIALEGQLDPVQVRRPGASGFLQDVPERLDAALNGVFRIRDRAGASGEPGIVSAFRCLHGIASPSAGFLHHDGKDQLHVIAHSIPGGNLGYQWPVGKHLIT